MRARWGTWALLALLTASPAAAVTARLDYAGTALTRREAEALLAPALRAPRDSAAASRALGAVVARLQQRGWLDAGAWLIPDSTDGPAVRLALSPGTRYRWGRVVVQAPSADDSAAFASRIALREGDWASPDAARDAVIGALRDVADHGHPYAQFGVTGWVADSGRVAVTLTGALGPGVTVSRVRVDGLQVTRPALLRRAVRRLEGAPWDRAAAESARERLLQMGLFERVSLGPPEGEGDWSKAQVVYTVVEPRYNRIEGVVGVQGEAGTVGLARLELGNVLGTGRAAAVRWEARGHGVAAFEARYAEPLLFNTPVRLEGAIGQDVQDTLFVRTRWGARARFALSGQEHLEAGYEQERVVQEEGELELAQVQSTVFALERSTLDQPFAARRGTRARVSAAQSFKRETLRPTGGRSARASAVELMTEWHRPLRSGAGLAVELRGAGRFSSQRLLPVFERYPVGGAASLRGHDEEAFRVDRYALARLEWRWFLGPGAQRVFAFWDHGWMATRLARTEGGDRLATEHADGIGVGLRLDTAGGVIGVDYGLEPGRAPLEGKIHLQLVSTF